jgi:outer membrane receptor protein involved in Fe transport
LNTGPLDLYDISQVEVFRGPQSTVQGRNALAGAVVLRTTDSSYQWNGKVRVMLTGPNGQRRAAAALGGPILGGQIAFRVTGEIARSNGLLYNATLHRDADPRKLETLRGKLLFTPAAVPGLRVVLTYMHDRHVRGAYAFEFDPPYDRRDRIVTEDVATDTRTLSYIATLEAHYTLGGGFDLSSITNYSNVHALYIADPDRTMGLSFNGRF